MAELSQTAPSPSHRRLVEGSTLGVGVILALALFAMVNYLSMRHYKRFDWTSSKLYTLSDKTRGVLASIDRDIDAVVFLSPNSEVYGAVDELLSRYAAENPARIRKRVIDPAKNLLEAQRLVEQHQIDRENVLVIATDSDRRVIDELDLAEYDYSGAQMGQPPTLQAFKGEQLITSAILELVEDKKPKILFTSGHGEGSLDGGERSLRQARDLLGQDNFEIEEWGSLGKSEVPKDTDLLVLAGPQSGFIEPELQLFDRYLEDGGRMLVLLDPVFSGSASRLDGAVDLGLTNWLASHGVELQQDIVIDPSQQLPFFGPETLFTDAYAFHPIVEALEQTRTPVLFSLARSVSQAAEPPEGYEVTELVRSSAAAWAETNLEALDEVAQDDQDLPGPVPLGVAVSFSIDRAAAETPAQDLLPDEDGDGPEALAEGEEPEDPQSTEEARLVVFGDYDFATDAQLANGANANLLLNTFNWLVQREQLIAIDARRPEQTKLNLNQGQLANIYALVLGVLPGLSIAVGIAVYIRRRR